MPGSKSGTRTVCAAPSRCAGDGSLGAMRITVRREACGGKPCRRQALQAASPAGGKPSGDGALFGMYADTARETTVSPQNIISGHLRLEIPMLGSAIPASILIILALALFAMAPSGDFFESDYYDMKWVERPSFPQSGHKLRSLAAEYIRAAYYMDVPRRHRYISLPASLFWNKGLSALFFLYFIALFLASVAAAVTGDVHLFNATAKLAIPAIIVVTFIGILFFTRYTPKIFTSEFNVRNIEEHLSPGLNDFFSASGKTPWDVLVLAKAVCGDTITNPYLVIFIPGRWYFALLPITLIEYVAPLFPHFRQDVALWVAAALFLIAVLLSIYDLHFLFAPNLERKISPCSDIKVRVMCRDLALYYGV
ncbi:hypothetical protein JKG47_01125 [Acidithiobacillus sp. MC6.1]|nr:hypothetical protein [Acidithiobacillus sp. MC6.1]